MLGIITYDCPHKKTSEIVERCSKKIDLIVKIPFKERPKRKVYINHRPFQFDGPSPNELGKIHSIEVIPITELITYKKNVINQLIVGGAGILEESLVNNYKIINAHPGLIPMTRGLDAFKWAIFNKEVLGITIHQINEKIDLGIHIHHSKTIIKENDNFNDLATRHYENEINCICKYIDGSLKKNKLINLTEKEPRKRMNYETELIMLKKFDEYKSYFLKSNLKNI